MTNSMTKNPPSINAVEGFNPSDFIRENLDEDGQKSLYLDVKYRLLWFRMKHPDGKVTTEIIHVDDKCAVVSCTLYNDRNDPADAYLAKSSAQRFSSQERFGDRYLEIAETAAMGRALAAAGYGTQFCVSPEEGGRNIIVDSPIEVSGPDEESQLPPAAGDSAVIGTHPVTAVRQGQTETVPNGNAPVSLEDYLNTMTVGQAQQVLVDVGYNKGMTLGQLAMHKPRDLEWYANHYAGHNLRLKAGSIILLNAARAQAG